MRIKFAIWGLAGWLTTSGAWAQGISPIGGSGGGYVAPTLGSTVINSGATVTTITGLASLGITAPAANSTALTISGGSHTGSNATGDVSIATTLNTTGTPNVVQIAVTDTSATVGTDFFKVLGGASGTTPIFRVDNHPGVSVGTIGGSGVLELAGAQDMSTAQGVITGQSGYLQLKAENNDSTSWWPYISITSNNSNDKGAIYLIGGGGGNASKASDASGSAVYVSLTSSGAQTDYFKIGGAGGTTGTAKFAGAIALGATITEGGTDTTVDTLLQRDAAGILAQVNGTNSQTFRLYNTSSSSNANYERGIFDWQGTSNVLSIGTEAAGTGTVRNLQFTIGGADKLDWSITNPGSNWTFLGNVYTSASNSITAGASVVANRVRSAGVYGLAALSQTADGVDLISPTASNHNLLLQDDAVGNTFGRLMLGGTSSSYPSIKRSAATLAFRLADDSADAAISSGTITTSGQIIAASMTQSSAVQTGTVCFAAAGLTYDATLGCLASSMRFKHDAEPLVGALDEVLRMQPISYLRNDRPDLGRQVGLMAEQVNEIDPRLVGYDGDGKPLGVRYMNTVALLVSAIQEINQKIEVRR